MHENFSKEEEIHISSNRSFGIVFTLVFLAVGAWMISVDRTEGWINFINSGFCSCSFRLYPILNQTPINTLSTHSIIMLGWQY